MVEVTGLLLMAAAGAGLIYLALGWAWTHPRSRFGSFVAEHWPWGTPAWARQRAEEKQQERAAAYREAIAAPDPMEDLEQGDLLVVETKEGPREVKAEAVLEELQFFGSDKSKKVHVGPDGSRLREFRARLLSGGQLLLQQPCKEGGDLGWFLYERADMPRGFPEYLRGTDGAPGPALRFAESNQQAHVVLKALGKQWVAEDIVWADVAVQRGTFFVGTRRTKARVAMILARRADDSGTWLLFIDLRSGSGGDTLWTGRRFDPAAEMV